MLAKKGKTKNEAKKHQSTKLHTHETSPANGHSKVQPSHPPVKQQSERSDTLPSTPNIRLTIKYDVGFSNQLYIRGKGANLSWDKGQLLKNVKPDEWVWETEVDFTSCEFKVLINDRIYESGDNRHLQADCPLVYTPHFY